MKRLSLLIFVVVITSLMGASIAAAQEPGQEDGRQGRRGARGAMIEIITEATGLTAEEIRDIAQTEDATLASIIEDNGGDVWMLSSRKSWRRSPRTRTKTRRKSKPKSSNA